LVVIYIFIFLFGAALGSFFNVCISRIPRKKSIVFPSSHCPSCGKNIRKRDNIPVFSYIFLKGKCRDCGLPIPLRYLIVEIITPALFLLLFFVNETRFDLVYLKYIVFISYGIILFFIDLDLKIIPDKLSLSLIVIGLIFAILPGSDISLKSALIGSSASFTLFLLMAYFFQLITKKDSLGGGDIKLIAGMGMILGLSGILFTIVISSVIALITLLLIKHDMKKEFPFGPFLIIAGILYLILGDLLIELYLNIFYHTY